MNDAESVVRIAAVRRDGSEVSGTGFLIDERGRVATCLHVVADATQLRVKLPQSGNLWRYEVLKTSAEDDLALIEPEVKPSQPTFHAALHPDWKKDVEIGDSVVAWGFSAWKNYETAQRLGCTISSFSEQTGLIGLNGSINPGDSGGPVMDDRHRVIGVVSAKDAERQGQAMFVPVSLLRRLVGDVIDDAQDGDGVRIAGDLPTADRGYPVIGREALVEQLKRALIDGHDQALVVLPGVGKTTLAATIVQDPDIAAHFSDGILWANLGKKPNIEAQLRSWVSALDISLASVKDSSDPVEALKTEVKRAIGTHRMLMILDDVWDEDAARILMSLGKRCVYLATTRDKEVASDLLGVGRKSTTVETLSNESGLALLRAIAPEAVAHDERAARSLVDAVSGLPLALVLIGKFLANAYEDEDAQQLEWAFEEMGKASVRLNLQVNKEQSLWSIVDVSYAALANEPLRRAFLALSIFRPDPHAFTADMAERICAVDRRALLALRNMGLIEFRKANDAESEDGYTMHRVIAEFGRARLADISSLEIPRLHGEAVRYYAARMNEDIEHDPAAYISKYRFEDRDWQRLKEAWLYHLAQTGDTVVALRAFLRVWFDAFWWWGYYQRFPFCGRLVAEWSTREIEQRGREGLARINAFEAAYPAGYDKRAGGDWATAKGALIGIRKAMRLDGPVQSLPDDDARWVRAYTEFFLAEATGYGPGGNAEAAMAFYHSAVDLFRACHATWEVNWALFYIAQYGRDHDDADRALTYCRRALDAALGTKAVEDVDPELLANLYRLLGELELAHDRDAAFAAWCRASLYASAFQAYPQDADAYTMAFYREITERIAGALMVLRRSDAAGALDLAARLRAYWSAATETACESDLPAALDGPFATDVARAIFPPDVPDESLSVDKEARAARIVAIVGRLRAALPDVRMPPRE